MFSSEAFGRTLTGLPVLSRTNTTKAGDSAGGGRRSVVSMLAIAAQGRATLWVIACAAGDGSIRCHRGGDPKVLALQEQAVIEVTNLGGERRLLPIVERIRPT